MSAALARRGAVTSALSLSFSLALAGCGAAEVPRPATEPVPLTAAPAMSGAEVPIGSAEPAAKSAVAQMLERVAASRGLPVLAPVADRTLDRARIGELIRGKAERELPPDVLGHETEALVALGLVSPSYDATDGMFSLIGSSISGFYEPDDKTMYLAADLEPAERDETLAHELVHALQDQHYDLGPLFKYKPDTDEAIAAAHGLAEGDATSAMFDVSRGDVLGVDERRFAVQVTASIAQLAPEVPAVLRGSLVAPYIDGFAFVQALRRRGGWAAVDAAWRDLPRTTEQLLHLGKYDAKEPAIEIAPPLLAGLARPAEKRSFTAAYSQVLGEQGLRLVLEEWTTPAEAAEAAAGWGGDRYVLAHGDSEGAAGERALAWQLRFDTELDAREMAAVLSKQAHGECVARPDVGPFAWLRKGRDVAVVMGPYRRTGGKSRSTGTCKEAKSWLAAILVTAKK